MECGEEERRKPVSADLRTDREISAALESRACQCVSFKTKYLLGFKIHWLVLV